MHANIATQLPRPLMRSVGRRAHRGRWAVSARSPPGCPSGLVRAIYEFVIRRSACRMLISPAGPTSTQPSGQTSLAFGSCGMSRFYRIQCNQARMRFGEHPKLPAEGQVSAPARSFDNARFDSASAIWTAFSAAPLRRLSDTTHMFSPFSIVESCRIRLT